MNNHQPERKIDVCGIGRAVLRTEGEAVLALIPKLGEEFAAAVDILYRCRGRIIVAGMGKAGIIARKISATLASTGSPSLSLHPVEALHGDLGMVGEDDVMVMISRSGESEEIKNLIPFVKRMGVALISITGNPASALAAHSDVVLDAGVEREACPLNLAPTASTTAALALGDALAVALIEKRNFRPVDFARLHPAGTLGKRLLLRVSDLMRKGDSNPVVGEESPVKEVILRITAARAGAASVIDRSGRLAGFFTDGDLRRHIEERPDILEQPVRLVMTRHPLTVEEDRLAVEALRLLGSRKVDELPVVNGKGEPVGMLDVQDLLNAGIV
ncbi:MAG: KpsF/GutQ family sugar-phosphate isomerase [PVC group bacterium]